MKFAIPVLLVALAVAALAAPGALAKPTPVSPAMFRSGDAVSRNAAPIGTSVELSPLARSELHLSNHAPVVAATQTVSHSDSSGPLDWTSFGVLAILGTGVVALTGLAVSLSRRIGGVAHP